MDAMQTPDGAWRVQVVKRDRTLWYRIVNDDNDITLDWLTIAAVQRVLEKAGVDMAELVPAESVPRRDNTAGVA